MREPSGIHSSAQIFDFTFTSIPCPNGRPACRGPVTLRKLPFEGVEMTESSTWFALSDVCCCYSIASTPTDVAWQIGVTGPVTGVFCCN